MKTTLTCASNPIIIRGILTSSNTVKIQQWNFISWRKDVVTYPVSFRSQNARKILVYHSREQKRVS